MLRFLFDTDHLTLYELGHQPLFQRVALEGPGAISVSAVTVEEALRGRLAYLARSLNSVARVRGYSLLLGTVRLFNQMTMIPFDHKSEAQYQRLRTQKTRVGTQDLKIAAVALTNNLTLVTCNLSDFSRIPGIVIEDWSI